ncbi:MAG: DUF4198 domain-containing protein [Planctomycetaceae bacterium]|nr:DUF4198 domain-containing protein [Planctomycetaceae bacterium]
MSTGCQDKNAIHVVAATGVVTLDGKPLEEAAISFVPTTEGLRGSSALSDENGKFTLMTAGAVKNGTMPGEYDVFVEKQTAVDAAGNPLVITADPNMMTGGSNSSVPETVVRWKSFVPQKYHDKAKPLFHVQVEKGGKNHFVLELDSK